jgi:FixJ family two-component response regulator
MVVSGRIPSMGPRPPVRMFDSARLEDGGRDGMPEASVTNKRAMLAVVDDSDSVRESLPDLLQEVGFSVQAFASAEAFLESGHHGTTSCLILDVGLPGMSGPDLQQELTRRGEKIPVVFITGDRDPSLCPRLLALGAAACLLKPFTDAALLEAVNHALKPR